MKKAVFILLITFISSSLCYSATISQLQISPNPFSPDGDGNEDATTISFMLSDTEAPVSVTIQISDSDGDVLLEDKRKRQAGLNEYVWDPGAGVLEYPDEEVCMVKIIVGEEEKASDSVTIDMRPVISILEISPNPFSPDGNGVNDILTIRYRLSKRSKVFVRIDDGNLLDLSLDFVDAGANSYDYAPAPDTFLEDGMHQLELIADTDGDGIDESDPKAEDNILVDVVGPRITLLHVEPELLSPDGDGIDDECQISFELSEEAQVSIKIIDESGNEVLSNTRKRSAGLNAYVWKPLQTIDNGLYTIFVMADEIEEGTEYDEQVMTYLRVAKEKAANIITNLSISPNPFSPNIHPKVDIAFVLSNEASVRIELSGVSIDEQKRRAGVNKFFFIPSESDGEYEIAVNADFNYDGIIDERTTRLFVIDSAPPTISLVKVSPSHISPNSDGLNDFAMISFKLSDTRPQPTPPGVDPGGSVGTVIFDDSGGFKWNAEGEPLPIPAGSGLSITPVTPPQDDILFTLNGEYKGKVVTEDIRLPKEVMASFPTVNVYDTITAITSISGAASGEQAQIDWFTGNVAVNIYTKEGAFVSPLLVEPGFHGDGLYQAEWRPNELQLDGEYIFRIIVQDDVGNASGQSGSIIVSNTPIEIKNPSISSNRISPLEQDTVADELIISFELSRPGNVNAKILDSSGGLSPSTPPEEVRELTPKEGAPLNYTVVWDGKDKDGVYSAILKKNGKPYLDENGDYIGIEQTFQFYISAIDPQTGEVAEYSGDVIVDNKEPDAPTITISEVSPTSKDTVTVKGIAESGCQVNILVNGNIVGTVLAQATGEYSMAEVALQEGWNLLNAQAIDSAGNNGPFAPSEQRIYVDKKAPVTKLAEEISDGWYNSSVSFSLSASDEPKDNPFASPGTYYVKTYYSIDGTPTANLEYMSESPTDELPDSEGRYQVTSPIEISGDGIHQIKFFSVDGAGNVESVQTATREVKIDTTPPTSKIDEEKIQGTKDEDGTFTDAPIFIKGTAGDSLSGVKNVKIGIKKDESITWQLVDGTTEWTYVFTPPSSGEYSFVTMATDVASNTEEYESKDYVAITVKINPAEEEATARAISKGRILLSWKTSGNYDIYRQTTDNFNSSSLVYATVENNNLWIDEDTRDGTKYYYWVLPEGEKPPENSRADERTSAIADSNPPQIENISASPTPFTPDGDRIDDFVTIHFTLTEKTKVTLRIYSSDCAVKTLIDGEEELPPGDHLVRWDGRGKCEEDGEEDYLPAGAYIFRFEKTGTFDSADNSILQDITGVIEIHESILVLNELKVLPNPFSPDGDKINDVASINYTLSASADYVSANIFDTSEGQRRIKSVYVQALRYIYDVGSGRWTGIHIDDGIPAGRSDEHYYLAPVDPKDSAEPPFEYEDIPIVAPTIEDYLANYQKDNPNWTPVSFSIKWDGSGATNQGAYIFQIAAADSSGRRTLDKTGEVTLSSILVVPNDKTPPTVIATSPLPSSEVQDQITQVSAILSDGQGTGIDLSQCTIRLQGSSGNVSGEQSNNGVDEITWKLDEPLDENGKDDGVYHIVISTIDLAGNASELLLFPFTYNMKARDVFPPKIVDNRAYISYVEDGETKSLVEGGFIADSERAQGEAPPLLTEEFNIVSANVADEEGTYRTGINFSASSIILIDPYGKTVEGYRSDRQDDLWKGTLAYQLQQDAHKGLDYGEYRIEVTPYDNAGNSGKKLTYTFRYRIEEDNTPPLKPEINFDLELNKRITFDITDESSKTQPSSGINYNATLVSISVKRDGNEIPGEITYTSGTDGKGNVKVKYEFALTGELLEGRYTATIVPSDNEGNEYLEEGEPISASYFLDQTPPKVIFSHPAEGDILQFFPEKIYVKLQDNVSSIVYDENKKPYTVIRLLNPKGEEVPTCDVESCADNSHWAIDFIPDEENPKEAHLLLNAPEEPSEELLALFLPGTYQLLVTPTDTYNRGAEEKISFVYDENATNISMYPPANSSVNGVINEIKFVFSHQSADFELNVASVAIEGPNGEEIIGKQASVIGKDTVVFTPTIPLTVDGWYSVTLTLEDREGNEIPFNMGFRYDNSPPLIVGADYQNAADIPPNNEPYVSITIEEAEDGSGIDFYRTKAFLLDSTGKLIPGYLSNGEAPQQGEIVNELTCKFILDNPLADGAYTIQAEAYDNAGNVKKEEINFNIDRMPPLFVSMTPEPDNAINGVIDEIKVEISDSGSGVNAEDTAITIFSPDGDEIIGEQLTEEAATDKSVSFLFRPTVQLSVNGWYTVNIDTVDNANNRINFTRSFFYDNVPPKIGRITALPTNAEVYEGRVLKGATEAISVEISDGGQPTSSGIDVKRARIVLWEKADEDSEEWNIVPGALNNGDTATTWHVNSMDGLTSSGLYKIDISVFDRAGNFIEKTVNFGYSNAPSLMPSLVSVTPAPSTRLNRPINVVTAKLKDNSGAGIDFARSSIMVSGPHASDLDTISNDQIDTLLYQFASPLATDGSSDGVYTVTIRAVDNAGNSSVFPAVQFFYDTQAPEVKSVYPQANENIGASISEVTAILADAGGSRIDLEKTKIVLENPKGEPIVGSQSDNGVSLLRYRFAPLADDGSADGIYTIKVSPVDVLGNETSIPIKVSFRYDTSAPTIKSATPEASSTIVTPIRSVRVLLTDGDGVGIDIEKSSIIVTGPGVSQQDSVSFEGKDELIYTFANPLRVDGTDDGVYIVSVKTVDLLQNTSSDLSYTFTYTAMAPVLVSITPADKSSLNEPIDEVVAILNDRGGEGIDPERTNLTLSVKRGDNTSVGEEISGVKSVSRDESVSGTEVPVYVFLRLNRSLATDGTDDGLYTIRLDAYDNSGAHATYTSTFNYDTRPPEVLDVAPDSGSSEKTFISKSISVVSARLRDDGVGVNLRDSEITLFRKDSRGGSTKLIGEKTDNGEDRISFTFEPLAADGSDDGEYTIIVTPVDQLGNTSALPSSKKFFYDTTPPSVVETTPASGATITSPINRVTVMLEDKISGVDFASSSLSLFGPHGKLNGTKGSDNENSLWLDFPTLKSDGSSDGTYEIRVFPVDIVGNAQKTPILSRFTYNTKAPTLVKVSPEDNAFINTPLNQISAVISDKSGKGLDLSRCGISVEGEGISSSDFQSVEGMDTLVYSFAESFATDGSDDGLYSATIVAVDKTNANATYTSRFTYDTQPPTIIEIKPAADSVTKEFPNEISALINDTYAGIDLGASSLKLIGPKGDVVGRKIDNGVDTIKLDFSDDVISNLNDGVYTIEVRPVDKLGNETAFPYLSKFRLDTTPPTITEVHIVSGTRITVVSDDTTITSPFEGIEVKLVDEYAGVDADSIKLRLLGPNGVLSLSTDYVNGLNGLLLSATLVRDGNQLTDGGYTLEVVAADTLGNSAVSRLHFTYATTVPELISINGRDYFKTEEPLFATEVPLQSVTVMFKDKSGTGIDFEKSNLSVQGPGVSAGDRIEHNGVDGLSWIFEHPLATDGSDDGIYLLNVTAKDLASNSIEYGPISFLYDTTPPTIVSGRVVSGGVVIGDIYQSQLTHKSPVIITSPFEQTEVTLSDDGVGVDLASSTIKLVGPNGPVKGTMTNDGVNTLRLRFEPLKDNGSDDGEYVILVNPKDKLGNGGSSALSFPFLYDTQPPILSKTYPAKGATITAPIPSVTVVLSDNLSGVDSVNTTISVFGPDHSKVEGERREAKQAIEWFFAEELASDGTDDGTYTIIVHPVDLAGNVVEKDIRVEFTYTTTSPLLISTTPKANSSVNSAITYISATIKDQSGAGLDLDNSRISLLGPNGLVNGTYQHDGDKTLFFYLDAPLRTDGSDDGEYEIRTLAMDKTKASANFVHKFIYDTEAPKVKSILPSDLSSRNLPISRISAVLEDAGSGVDVSNSTITLKGPKGPIVGRQTNDGVNTINLEFGEIKDDGIYQILIQPEDNAGNAPPQKITSSFVLDTRPPQVVSASVSSGSIVIPLGETTQPRSVEVSIDSVSVALRDELSGVDMDKSTLSLVGPRGKIEGIAQSERTEAFSDTLTLKFAPLPLDGTANGEYQIFVTARDMASNVLDNTLAGSFVYQPTAPKLLSTAPSDGDKFSTPINTISAVLLDRSKSGINLQQTKMKALAPNGEELSGTLTKATGAGLSDEDGKIKLTLQLEKLFATDGSEDGRYEVHIVAVDNRGNSGAYFFHFLYDTTAPQVAATNPADGSVLNTPLSSVSATFQDEYAGIDLAGSSINLYQRKFGKASVSSQINGIQKNDGDKHIKLEFPALSDDGSSDGVYTISVTPVDMLKNTLAEPLKYTFIYDTTPPRLIKTNPASKALLTGVRLFKVSAYVSDEGGVDGKKSKITVTGPDGETVTGVNVASDNGQPEYTEITFFFDEPLSVDGDDDGEYRIKITTVDLAHNTSVATSTFTYDSGSIDAPKIEYLSAIPYAFSPNADGVQDITRISYQLDRLSSVTAEILTADGDSVRLLAEKHLQPSGKHTLTWNGMGHKGVFAPDGEYIARIVATDMKTYKKRTSETRIILDTQPPAVSVPALSSNPITPNGDGFNDTTTLSFSISNSNPTDGLKVDFYKSNDDGNSPSSALINPPFKGDGEYSVTWDGTDGITNTPLPDGEYRYVIEAFDQAGNSRASSGVLLLDGSPPQIKIEMVDGSTPESTGKLTYTNSSPITITGVIWDVSPIQYLEVSIKKDGKTFSDWSKIEIQPDKTRLTENRQPKEDAQNQRGPLAGSSGSFVFRLAPPGDGRYDFSLRASDAIGQETLLNDIVAVVYDTTPPEHLSTNFYSELNGLTEEKKPGKNVGKSLMSCDSVSNGQKIIVKSLWDAAGYAVTVDISSLDSESPGEAVQAEDRGDGLYVLEYRISPANKAADGEKRIKIQATDVAGNKTIVDSVRLRLDNIAPKILSLETSPSHIFKNGDKVTLKLKADSEGYRVFADFHPLDTEYVDGLESAESLGGGDYRIYYQISRRNASDDGEIPIIVSVTDNANVVRRDVVLTLDNTPPAILSLDVANSPDRIVGNGTDLTLLLLADAPGYRVSADFSEIDSEYKNGEETVTDKRNGNYLISYKISDENTTADGKELKVFVKVADTANNETSKYITLDLDNTPPEIKSINNLDEDNIYKNGDTITLSLTLKDDSEKRSDEPTGRFIPASSSGVALISANFGAVDSTYTASKVSYVETKEFEYTIQYTISQNNSKGKDKTLKNLPVVITVSDGRNEISDDSFLLELDNHPPALTVEKPAEGEVIFDSSVTVSGTVESGSTLLINGVIREYDEQMPSESGSGEAIRGSFEIILKVNPDINDIEIKAVDKAGNTTVIKRRVKYIPRATVEEGGEILLTEEVDDGIPDNETRIKIPPKALRKDAAVIIERIPDFNGTPALRPLATYKFSLIEIDKKYSAKTQVKETVQFSAPVEITLQYSDLNLETERNIKIFRWDGVRWREVGGRLDADKNTVTVKINSLSIYAVIATYPELYGETENKSRKPQPFLTPNGDGWNDSVDFTLEDMTIIRIFDKRGKIIRKVTANGNKWSWRGEDDANAIVQPGLYIYQVEFVDGRIKTGTIVVAR